ncbi:RimK/LysX family protein [Candidatus Kuenenia sp.]|uniref:ATP-dependent zinc protease family protein n=1 Tax=Candidatus Kuenenia sp. TaxID=2499824 RepID=UPI003220308C
MVKSMFPPFQGCEIATAGFIQRFVSHLLLYKTKSIFIIASLFLVFAFHSLSDAKSKEILGRVEKVLIFPGNIVLKAKVDTGAKTCSINAPVYALFERDGEKWVKFELINEKGEKLNIEEKVIRTATVKRIGMPSEKRPVIKLGICIGDIYKEVEVSLSNRTRFMYQILIGRNFLLNDFFIDVSSSYSKEPKCKSVSGDE